jgi:uncharacterized RDD family membrane protein YckC
MSPRARLSVSGHYAGPVSRAAAALVDGGLIMALYTLGYAGLNLLLSAFFGHSLSGDQSTPLAVASLATWAFLYVFVSLAITGRTAGKGLAGLRVVSADGAAPSVGALFLRTLVFPISAMLFGVGFLLIVVRRDNRGLHDLIAHTAVVYDWGDRPAEMPGPLSDFLNRAEPTPQVDDAQPTAPTETG